MTTSTPLLSLIIPAYNEAERLPRTMPSVIAFVESQDFASEVIIVNNNSQDATRKIALDFAAQYPFIRVIDEETQGKGAAVRTGMLAAQGEYLFMADADFSMPVEEVTKFLPPQLSGYDVAIGSREAEGAVRYNEPEYRHFMGRVFNFYVKVLAIPGFEDTQCGFKCFRREAALDILPYQTIDGWAFDVELLFIALQRGYRVVEIPVQWYYGANSRISPVRDTINMIREVLRIRMNGWNGRYTTQPEPSPIAGKPNNLTVRQRPSPTIQPEQAFARTTAVTAVAGLDEAGRGALAGPVYAAAVILPLDDVTITQTLDQVNDSKLLNALRRETLFPLISQHAVTSGIGYSSAQEIDRLGIIGATVLAMERALDRLVPAAQAALIDGRIRLRTTTIPQKSIIRGDSQSLSIAAASILAKVSRDHHMQQMELAYPEYGFAQHKGYGTAAHMAAIHTHGPCPEHRLSFAPFRIDAES